jgi:hypothetical protein
MRKLRCLLPVLTLAILPAGLGAADPELLRLVMPDAKVVAGLQVDRTRDSQFGQFVLSHLQLDDPAFQQFVSETGFDPRKEVKELLIASNWKSANGQPSWVVMAKGNFDLQRIQRAAEANGAAMTTFQGASVFSFAGKGSPDSDNAIAFLDPATAVMGSTASVNAAIQRKQAGAAASSDLAGKAKDLSAKNDFWFVTLVPLSQFDLVLPTPNSGGPMNNNMFMAINQASGGIRFGEIVTVSADIVARSDKDAQALVDVVKFVVGMLQQNRQNNPVAGQASNMLDPLETKTEGNRMSMSLAIPEEQLERLFNNVARPGRTAPDSTPRKPAPQRN